MKQQQQQLRLSLFFFFFFFFFSLITTLSLSFQSDELLLEDDEFIGLDPTAAKSQPSIIDHQPPISTSTVRKRSHSDSNSNSNSDSKIQFKLDHAFGDNLFAHAGTFNARLKSWSNGAQTLTKLRFSREAFTVEEKKKFQKLLQEDDFYTIRLPSNVLDPPGRDFIISSVKARCLVREGLDEHIVIHMEGVNILAVNFGAPGACPYPRALKFPAKWSFNSHTVLKHSELAPRTPIFAEVTLGQEDAEGELVQQPEKSFWGKYWMYMLPLGLVVMNVFTQAMNMPEEQASGQAPSQVQQTAAVQRGPSTVRRR